jgi:hypothetical protein
MKDKPAMLIVLCVAAIVAALTGTIWTARSLVQLPRDVVAYQKKVSDIRELSAMQRTVLGHRALLAERRRMEKTPISLSELVHDALPGKEAAIREMEATPTLPGWTARRASVALSDVSGDDLGRLLHDAANRQPPWSLLEGVLQASPTAGRLAKVELVFGSIEMTAGQ